MQFFGDSLIDVILRLADIEPVSSTFLDKTEDVDNELQRIVNQSWAELQDIVLKHASTDYHLLSATETIGSSTSRDYNGDGTPEAYPAVVGSIYLPADFYLLRAAFWKPDSSTYIPLRPASIGNIDDTGSAYYGRWAQYGTKRVGYHLTGTMAANATVPQLRVSPRDITGDIEVWYVPKYTHQVFYTNSPHDPYRGWEEYVAYTAAIKLLQKERSDTTALEKRKARILSRIMRGASKANSAHPIRVSDRDHLEGFYSG